MLETLLLFLFGVGVLYLAFVFFFSSSAIILTRKRAGCFTLIILYICVPCPFLKVQWISQESVIVAVPGHVHL